MSTPPKRPRFLWIPREASQKHTTTETMSSRLNVQATIPARSVIRSEFGSTSGGGDNVHYQGVPALVWGEAEDCSCAVHNYLVYIWVLKAGQDLPSLALD